MRFIKKHKIFTIILIVLSIYLYNNYTRVVETNNLVDKNSIHYVNDLYASSGRIYSDYLDNSEKKLYMKIVDNTKNYDDTLYLNIDDYDCKSIDELIDKLYTVFYAIPADHPELMNYAGMGWRYDSPKAKTLTLTLHFAFQNKYKEYIGQLRIQKIISDIKIATRNMNEAQKVKYVYDWIGDNTRYDYTFMTFSKNQSIYNVFMKGNAVCAGFAKASLIILQNIGVEAYAVSGNTEGPHMWNIVKVNGKYYYYDSTVAACRKKSSPGYYDGLKETKFDGYSQRYSNWYKDFKLEEKDGILK